MFSRGIGSMKVEGGLCGNQEDVVCSDLHNGSLNGRLAGVGAPVWRVRGKSVVQTSLAFLLGVRTQEPPDILSEIRNQTLENQIW